MSNELAAIIDERSRRAVANILHAAERLPMDRERFVRTVRAEVGDVNRVAMNLIGALDQQLRDGFALNQLWLDQIASHLGVEVVDVEARDAAG